MNPFAQDIENALQVLQNGGIILYPTDTVWGIGCDAANKKAIEAIHTLKKSKENKSMLILVSGEAMLDSYVQHIPDIAWELLEAADNPLTIIYPGAKNLPGNLPDADNSIGIRITSDKFCKALINRLKKPVVSTSANFFGEPNPGNFYEIHPDIIKNVDYVVKHRQYKNTPAKPSGIIKIGTNNEVKIIRH